METLEAERLVLGTCLLDTKLFDDLSCNINQETFTDRSHAVIWDGMVSLRNDNPPSKINLVALSSRLRVLGTIEAAGGFDYLSGLGKCDSREDAIKISHLLRTDFLRRKTAEACEYVQKSVVSQVDQGALVGLVESTFDFLKQGMDVSSVLRADEGFKRHIKDIVKPDMSTVVRTGIGPLDDLMVAKPGDWTVIAARPGIGKTALALNIAEHEARNNSVAFFSLEMPMRQLLIRMIASALGISMRRLSKGQIKKDEEYSIESLLTQYNVSNMYIDDSSYLTPSLLRSKIRGLKRLASNRQRTLTLVIVDYLQLMHGGKGYRQRVEEVAEITRSIKAIAKDENVHIMALCQLNREIEKQTNWKGEKVHRAPQLSDLRESGSIEQDADIVMAIESYEEEYRLHIIKQRNGPLGVVPVAFIGDLCKFKAITPAEGEFF